MSGTFILEKSGRQSSAFTLCIFMGCAKLSLQTRFLPFYSERRFCCNISRLKEPVLTSSGTDVMVLYRVGNYQFIMQTCSPDLLALPINLATVDGVLYKYTYIVLFESSSQSHYTLLKKYFNITSCLLVNNSHVERVKYLTNKTHQNHNLNKH
jgi:hypothetical protein